MHSSGTAERPEIKLPLDRIDWLLIGVGIVSIAGLIGIWIATWPLLPDNIPAELPANLSRKSEIAIVPILSLKCYIIVMAVSAAPSIYNYPWRITAENAETSYRLMRRVVFAFAVALPWLPFAFYLKLVHTLTSMGS